MEKARVLMFFPNESVYSSGDICGNISNDGITKEIVRTMDAVEYLDEMSTFVEELNLKNCGKKYKHNVHNLTRSFSNSDLRDMCDNYEKKFGVTWLFVKNVSCSPLEIRAADGETYSLPHRKLAVFYCGIPCDGYEDRLECAERTYNAA